MKTTLLSIFLFGAISGSIAQSVTRTLNWEGKDRQYLLHVPASYDGSVKVPLVFVLHGLGDNMTNMEGVGMTSIGDTANFITITPQAWADPLAGTAWNSGAGANFGGFEYYPNENVDDVGFIGKMIDETAAEFNIDKRRVYSCGFSMGAFMTDRLACELNDRIAAFGPVAATIGAGITCNPGRALPIIAFHGTADATVSYDSASFGFSVPQFLEFWENNNGCTSVDSVDVPDIANDGYTVKHLTWNNCSPNSALEHFKVIGADHTWLGPNDDIFYTAEIWKFFSRFEHPNQSLGLNDNDEVKNTFSVIPNPVEKGNPFSLVTNTDVEKITLTDMSGKLVWEGEPSLGLISLQTDNIEVGVYTVSLLSKSGSIKRNKLVLR